MDRLSRERGHREDVVVTGMRVERSKGGGPLGESFSSFFGYRVFGD